MRKAVVRIICIILAILMMLSVIGVCIQGSAAYGYAVFPVESNELLAGKTIIIDPGHGKGTGGAYQGYVEYVYMLKLGLMLRENLEACGATVYMTHETDANPDGFIRMSRVNKLCLQTVRTKWETVLETGTGEEAENAQEELDEIDRLIGVMDLVINDYETYAPIYYNSPYDYTFTRQIHPDIEKIFEYENDPLIYENFLFISLHSNATPTPINTKSNGVTGYYLSNTCEDCAGYYQNYTQVERSRRLADVVTQHICDAAGFRRVGLVDNDYFMIRETNIPRTMQEIGFHTNTEDRERLTNETTQKRIVNGITLAFLEYFNVMPENFNLSNMKLSPENGRITDVEPGTSVREFTEFWQMYYLSSRPATESEPENESAISEGPESSLPADEAELKDPEIAALADGETPDVTENTELPEEPTSDEPEVTDQLPAQEPAAPDDKQSSEESEVPDSEKNPTDETEASSVTADGVTEAPAFEETPAEPLEEPTQEAITEQPEELTEEQQTPDAAELQPEAEPEPVPDPVLTVKIMSDDGKVKTSGTMYTGDKACFYLDGELDGKYTVFVTGEDATYVGSQKKGWHVNDYDGSRYYYVKDKKPANGFVTIKKKTYLFTNGKELLGWQTVSGKTYYMDPGTGVRTTGWKTIDGDTYYFSSSGVMQTGIVKINKTYYAFDENGHSITADGFHLTGGKVCYVSDGKALTGWQTITDDAGSSVRYYFSAGVMQTGVVKIGKVYYGFSLTGKELFGEQTIGGKTYDFGEDGKALIGWQTVNGKKYYYNSLGVKQTGALKISKAYYGFDEDGVMLTGWQTMDGKTYHYGTNGKAATGKKTLTAPDGGSNVYYFNSSGVMQTGVIKIGSYYYAFGEDGKELYSWQTVGRNTYYFKATGRACTGQKALTAPDGSAEQTYYFNKRGEMQTGIIKVGSYYYCFAEDGTKQTETGWHTVDGKTCYVKKGKAVNGWQTITDEAGISGKYYFSAGILQTGLKKIGSYYYAFGENGKMLTGWQTVGGSTYFFGANGRAYTGRKTIAGVTYTFSKKGICSAPPILK